MNKIVGKVIGNTTSTPMAIPDWEQTDSTKADFIKNKPDIDGKINAVKKDIAELEKIVDKKANDFMVEGIQKEVENITENVNKTTSYVDIMRNELVKTSSALPFKADKSSLEAVSDKVEGIEKDVSALDNSLKTVSDALLSHDSNENIHVTPDEKTKWNDADKKFALNENGVIEVEYSTNNASVLTGSSHNIIEYYDAKGNAVDLNDPQAHENLHTGIYKIKVKSIDEMIDYDDDLNEIGRTPSDSYSEDIVVQHVYRYNTKYDTIYASMLGAIVIRQYLLTGTYMDEVLFRQATIKLDGTVETDDYWTNVLKNFEDCRYKLSNMNNPESEGYEEYYYPNVKAVKDYVDTSAELNTIVNTAEGSVISVTDSANAKLKGLTIYGKTTQEGEPSVENPQPLVNVGNSESITTKVCGKNLFADVRVSAVNMRNRKTTARLSNDYGTTINSTTYDNKIIVTQDIANEENEDRYVNGFFVLEVGRDYFRYGKTYTFIADINVTSNPLNRKYIRVLYQAGERQIDVSLNNRIAVSFTHSQSTTSPDDNTIEIRCSGMSFELSNIMLVEGDVTSKLPEYEPFKEQALTFNTPNGLPGVPVASGGNYTDENGQQYMCDEIDGARSKYIERTAEWKYTGVETLTISSVETNDNLNSVTFNIRINGIISLVTTAILSNCLTHKGNYAGHLYNCYVKNNIPNYVYMTIRDADLGITLPNTLTSKELVVKVKEWLIATFTEENPLIFRHLIEPIERDLTEEEISQYKALTTHKPITNIVNDADAHMKVDYVADPKNYIDNKFANIENAILSLGGNV